MLIDAYGVAVSETQELRHSVGIKQIVDVDASTHHRKITAVVGSVRPVS
jgi:hypothetical protein